MVEPRREVLAWLILAFRPPSEQTATLMGEADLEGMLEALGIDPAPLVRESIMGSPRWVERHQSEYVRLFLNSRTTPVAHLEGLAYLVDAGPGAQGAYLEGLSHEYESAGFGVSPGSPVSADHLTVLLEYLYWIGAEAEALGDRMRGLLAWIPDFLARLRNADPPAHYQNAGYVLSSLLKVLGLDETGANKPMAEDGRSPASGERQFGHPVLDSVPRSVLESITDGVMVIDGEKRIVFVNGVLAGYYGLAPEDLVGKKCEEVIGFDHCRACPHADILDAKEPFTGHNLNCERTGLGPFCVSGSPLRDEQNNVVGIVEVYRDMRSLGAYIEEIEQRNVTLDLERRRTDEILSGSSDGYYTAGVDRTIQRVDDKLLDLLGMKTEDVLGKGCNEVFGSDKCETDCPIRWAVKNDQNVIACREQIRSAHGVLPVDKSVFVQRDERGTTTEVIGVIRNASEIVELRRSTRQARRHLKLLSRSVRMEGVFNLVSTFGPTDETVLILGESGTGKELVADAVQAESPRRNRPFIKINCSALTEELLASELFGHVKGAFTGADSYKSGKFEAADRGTIFLDEVGDMSPALQTKVLRVLEQREFEPVGSTETRRVSVRIIAATNKDLKKAMQEGRFREDLYYRLNAIQIHMPPLRERPEDIPLLVRQFMADLNATYGRGIERISSRALDLLTKYSWPGNVRELRNAINFAYVCATGERIERQDLPETFSDLQVDPEIRENTRLGIPEDEEKKRILKALSLANGNREVAAKSLGVSRTTLWRKLKSYEAKSG